MSDTPDYLNVLGAACSLVADYGARVWHGTRSDGLSVAVVRIDGGCLVSLSRGGRIVAADSSYTADGAAALLRAADGCARNYAEACAAGVSL